ncbi:MAG: NPCBM/NEW2 domain-containing protein [Planctomycetes bacterium]|nr:NPCBM/NEW2 domain-containing protein [Planctomycetota bacterium]
MKSRFLYCGLLFAWLSGGGFVSSASAQLLFRAEQSDGEAVVGQIVSLSADEITLESKTDGESTKTTIALSRLIHLKQQPRDRWKILPPVGRPWVFLATGDRLCIEPSTIDDSELTAQWSRFEALPPLKIPLEACRGIAFTFPSDAVKQGLIVSSVTGRTDKSDLIVLRNGDRLQGELSGLTEGVAEIETSLGSVKPKARLIERLVFNPELVFAEKPDGPVTTVLLSDGSVLKLKEATATGLALNGTMLAGTKVVLPLEEIHELTVSGGEAVPLASVSSYSKTVASFPDTKRPPRAGSNVLGGFLSLRGRPALTGLGVAGGTTLSWELDGSWKSFQATCGVDDAARGRGSVIFEVRLDDKSVWHSEELTGESQPVPVPPVDLAGAKTLTLRVEYAQQGNVLDYADWTDAVLIRGE